MTTEEREQRLAEILADPDRTFAFMLIIIADFKEKVRALEQEIAILRQYGNKDCAAMADARLAELQAASSSSPSGS